MELFVQNFDRILKLSEVLDEFTDELGLSDRLVIADYITKAHKSDFASEIDRPLNDFNPNHYSRPVDLVIGKDDLRLAIQENFCGDEESSVGVSCSKKQFNEFCHEMARRTYV